MHTKRVYIRHDVKVDVSGVKIPFLTDEMPRNFKGMGIYCIYNIVTHKFYIGSTNDFMDRRTEHFCNLVKNKHTNGRLRNSFNKYGRNAFAFLLIEHCPEDKLIEREQFYLDKYLCWKPEIGYNISDKAGRGLTRNNIESIRKLSESHSQEIKVFTPTGKLITIHGIKKYCKANGLNYSAFLNMKRGLSKSSAGYRVFNSDVYEERDLTEDELTAIKRKEYIEKNCIIKYKFLFNKEKIIEVDNLSEFAKSNNLKTEALRSLYSGVKKSSLNGYVSMKNEEIMKMQLENFNKLHCYDYYLLDKFGVVRQMRNLSRMAEFINADNSSVSDAIIQNRRCKGYYPMRKLINWEKDKENYLLL